MRIECRIHLRRNEDKGWGKGVGAGTGQDSPNSHSLPYGGAVSIYSYHLRKSMDVKLNNMSKAIQCQMAQQDLSLDLFDYVTWPW